MPAEGRPAPTHHVRLRAVSLRWAVPPWLTAGLLCIAQAASAGRDKRFPHIHTLDLNQNTMKEEHQRSISLRTQRQSSKLVHLLGPLHIPAASGEHLGSIWGHWILLVQGLRILARLEEGRQAVRGDEGAEADRVPTLGQLTHNKASLHLGSKAMNPLSL